MWGILGMVKQLSRTSSNKVLWLVVVVLGWGIDCVKYFMEISL